MQFPFALDFLPASHLSPLFSRIPATPLVLILARNRIDPGVRVVPFAEEMVQDWCILNISIEKHHLTSLIMLSLSFEFPSPGLDPHHFLPGLAPISSSSSRHPSM
jgi:hypothetical protein